MKLNYKRTLLVGFAFFLICTFWQAYDTIIPKILTDKFGMSQLASGAIMALDNVLALFLLPLFGAISDKCNSKMGRRTPFILVGTLVAALLFVGLSFADNIQLAKLDEVSTADKASLEFLYDYDYKGELITPDGEKFTLQEKFTREEFTSITLTEDKIDKRTGEIVLDKNGDPVQVTNSNYTNYVATARQAYARQQTAKDPSTLILFMGLLFLVLVSMATFRSPAVALMPDVTVKPLRSKANAVINLMGSFGGILVLALGMVMKTGDPSNSMMSYTLYFEIVAGIMLVALAIFMLTVKEPKFVSEMKADSEKYGISDAEDDNKGGKAKLSKAEKLSLALILASVVLWFMGYNAVTSKYSVYAGKVLALDYNLTLIIAQVAAIISYLPVGMISSRIGRKKAILAGVVMLTSAFTAGIFLDDQTPGIVMNIVFALAGIGWATINVNSFPMVVELARGSNVGKYTGFYYTASMAAQVITPLLSGWFLDNMGMRSLFPYAAIFTSCAFITMLFVRHGDSKPGAVKGIEAFDTND